MRTLYFHPAVSSSFYGRLIEYGRPLYFCPVASSSIYLSSSFFFPRLISAVADWIYAILPHMMCDLSANLGCRSEMCCTRLAGNAGPKKSPKNRHLRMHRTILSGYIFATKAHIDNRKKLVKQKYLLHMSSQYGELRPTSG